MSPPYAAIPGGARLAVRLTPRAHHDKVEGIAPDAQGRPVLLLKLTAPPVEGAANAALIAYVAKSLGLPKSAVVIAAGDTSRQKSLRIQAPDALERLERWLAVAAEGRA
ncbi:DUF167 domain-containing protein [Rhodovarius crocodyli]|uniref:UPF0235 protein EOD42_23145 n=1 Tax=Rhodovarius crocodyli TaxID=1979269 RepID=A0A437LZ61_9PROT|nr:DUF167 domain-containing protein [Rhodovarius crocodyli]RVT90700.1 DUF167 domain-containing protein [Rhodovarius crocodyli]